MFCICRFHFRDLCQHNCVLPPSPHSWWFLWLFVYIYSYGIDARFGVFVQLSLWQIMFFWWTTVTHAICTRVDTKNVISFFRRWIYFYSASKYCGLLPILIFHPLSVILLSVMKDHVNKYIYIYIYYEYSNIGKGGTRYIYM